MHTMSEMLIDKEVELVLGLLGIISLLSVIAVRFRFPFPVLLVFAGLAIGLTPGLPHVEIEARWVFLVFLPPLLFGSAVLFPWKEFRANLRSIFLLAIGLVLTTTAAVAFSTWWLIPGMSLAAGFVLGAIVSPPDAVAANSVLKNLAVPQRVQNVLEGESLVNDASGLVAWQFAVAALVTGTFSLRLAAMEFFVMSIGGVIVGLLLAAAIAAMMKRVQDRVVEMTLFMMTPYMVYLAAEHFEVSGVLGVVAAGMYIGHHSDAILSSRARVEGVPVWSFVLNLLNSLVFILIGLQFPRMMESLTGVPTLHLAGYVLLVVGVVVFVRFVWIFAISWLLKRVFIPKAFKEPPIETRHLIIMSWCGMRGVVSLAAAMAVPYANKAGEPISERGLILFLTFGVIFATLVLPSLSLPRMVRWLRADVGNASSDSEMHVRARILELALESLDTLSASAGIDPHRPLILSLRKHYEDRLHRYVSRLEVVDDQPPDPSAVRLVISRVANQMRQDLLSIYESGEIDSEIRHRIRMEIDVDELQLLSLLAKNRNG